MLRWVYNNKYIVEYITVIYYNKMIKITRMKEWGAHIWGKVS